MPLDNQRKPALIVVGEAIFCWLAFRLCIFGVNALLRAVIRASLLPYTATTEMLNILAQRNLDRLSPVVNVLTPCLFLLLLFGSCFLFKTHLLREVRLYPIPGKAAALLLFAGFSASAALSLLLRSIPFPLFLMRDYEQAVALVTGHDFFSLLGAVLIAPLAEEILYRGFLYRKTRSVTPVIFAMAASGAVFALDHENILQVAYTFLLSFLLCRLYEKTHSLLSSILFHVGFNVGAYVILFIPRALPAVWSLVLFAGFLLLSAFLVFLALHSVKYWVPSEAELQDDAPVFAPPPLDELYEQLLENSENDLPPEQSNH